MDARLLFDRWLTAMNELDFDALETMLHPGFVAFYPQSGEALRGYEAFRSMLERDFAPELAAPLGASLPPLGAT